MTEAEAGNTKETKNHEGNGVSSISIVTAFFLAMKQIEIE